MANARIILRGFLLPCCTEAAGKVRGFAVSSLSVLIAQFVRAGHLCLAPVCATSAVLGPFLGPLCMFHSWSSCHSCCCCCACSVVYRVSLLRLPALPVCVSCCCYIARMHLSHSCVDIFCSVIVFVHYWLCSSLPLSFQLSLSMLRLVRRRSRCVLPLCRYLLV